MIDRDTFERFANDPVAFRDALIVDVDGEPKRFGDVQDDWQRKDFAALDPALRLCSGRKSDGDESAKMRAYLERPRGHSKTTDLAIMACYVMAFATRPLKGYSFAADKDQASLLRDAIRTIIRLNPWLGEILEVGVNRVTNKADGHPGHGSVLEISASDVGSSYGILADFIIADELTHWLATIALWISLLSSAAKRRNCLLVVISNAGFADSWQWEVREAARTDPAWYFSRLDGPVASWMKGDRLAQQRRMLPPAAYDRLWGNQWSSRDGDALPEEDIAAAFSDHLLPMFQKVPGWEYVAGVDLSVSQDATAVCVIGVCKRGERDRDRSDHGRIRLAFTKVWRPIGGRKIDLGEIERTLLTLHHGFDFKAVPYDPWQGMLMAQRLALSRLPMQEVPPTGSNLQKMATTLIEAFSDRRVDLFDDNNLRRELQRLRIEERSYGFRLVSPRDKTGHGDLATAFSLAMLAASERAGKKAVYLGAFTDDSSSPEDDPRHSERMMIRDTWSRMVRDQYEDRRF